jgi:hypothetical protein
MNRAVLQSTLKENNVPEDLYCLTGGLPNEAYCIATDGDGQWFTYYSERGVRSGLKVFKTEDEACRDLLATLLPGLDASDL